MSEDTRHEVFRGITSLPGWDASLSQSYPGPRFLCYSNYARGWRGTIRRGVKCLQATGHPHCGNISLFLQHKWSNEECYPSGMSRYPLLNGSGKETMWNKAYCLRNQHDVRGAQCPLSKGTLQRKANNQTRITELLERKSDG